MTDGGLPQPWTDRETRENCTEIVTEEHQFIAVLGYGSPNLIQHVNLIKIGMVKFLRG